MRTTFNILFGIIICVMLALSPSVAGADEELYEDVEAFEEEEDAEPAEEEEEEEPPEKTDEKEDDSEEKGNGAYDKFLDRDGDRVDDRWKGFLPKKQDEKKPEEKREREEPPKEQRRKDSPPRAKKIGITKRGKR